MTELGLCVQILRALLHTAFGDYLFSISLTFLPCFACIHDFLFSLTDLNVCYQDFFSLNFATELNILHGRILLMLMIIQLESIP